VAEAPKNSRIVRRDGRFNITAPGAPIRSFSDLAHLLLTMGWGRFIALLITGYFAVNALFALVYLACGDIIDGAEPGSFRDAFDFSVQTMSTIGYGGLSPATPLADVLVAIESMVGLLGFAVVTGLMFAKFARPTARVLFSETAVVRPRDGQPTLQFRIANQRGNKIVDAEMNLIVVYDHVTQEGEAMRSFLPMPLVRERSPMFALSWTGMHVIDDASPLHGRDREWFVAKNAELVVTLSGIDDTFNQPVHAQFSYVAAEIRWNHAFADIIRLNPDGTRSIDYDAFHATREL